MNKPNILPIKRLLGSGDMDEGESLGIRVEDDKGMECVILLPHEMETDFLFRLEAAAEAAGAKRKDGNRRADKTMPIGIDGMQTFIVTDNLAILRILMENGMKLDLPMDDQMRSDLRQLIDGVDAKLLDPTEPVKKPH